MIVELIKLSIFVVQLIFKSQQSTTQDNSDAADRKLHKVSSAPVFPVLRQAEQLEKHGQYDEAVALLEDFIAETNNSMFREMCQKRLARIAAVRSIQQLPEGVQSADPASPPPQPPRDTYVME